MPRWPSQETEVEAQAKPVAKAKPRKSVNPGINGLESQAPSQSATIDVKDLASAISAGTVAAIEASRPKKKTAFNRKQNTPWTPKDGSKKLKLKRKFYQHGLLIPDTFVSNEEIDLMNQVRPGRYCDGYVKVVRRRDKGIEIDYPMKSVSQRMKLVNQFGIRNLKELLARCIEEAANPIKSAEDAEGY